MDGSADRKQAARFLQTAVRKGLIDQAQARTVLTRVDRGEGRPDELLVRDGLLTPHVVGTIQKAVELAEGPVRIGGYRITGKLGKGGMGTVYRAVQESLGREVALKVISRELMRDRAMVERFLREGRAAGKVNHPNVITVHDVGEDAGRLYMAIELVTGGDVERLAKEQPGHRLPEEQALRLIRDAARGLEAVHAAGLVHRDIKPANILLTQDGMAKLADLGLARSEDGEDRLTMSGCTIGTPSYMSPEQANGERDLDIRADIYSLGATLFTLLCGRPPFAGGNAFSVVVQVLNEPVPDPRSLNPEISRGTTALVMRALAKDPADRFPTPTELRRAIDGLLDGAGAAGGGRPPGNALVIHRRWIIGGAIAAGVMVLIIVGMIIASAVGGSGPRDPTTPTVADAPPVPAPPPTTGVQAPPLPAPVPPVAPPPPDGPPLAWAVGIDLPRPAATCAALEQSRWGRIYRSPAWSRFANALTAGLTAVADHLGLTAARLLDDVSRLELRLVADPRLSARDPSKPTAELVVTLPGQIERYWTRLAATAGEAASVATVQVDDAWISHDGDRLIAHLNAAARPSSAPRAVLPPSTEHDLVVFLDPAVLIAHNRPGLVRVPGGPDLGRLRMEGFARLHPEHDETDLALPGLAWELPPIDRTVLRFVPTDVLAIGIVSLHGTRLLELAELGDAATGEHTLADYRLRAKTSGLPDLDASFAQWRGTVCAIITAGAVLPHLHLALPSAPDFDQHFARSIELGPSLLDLAERQPVPFPGGSEAWQWHVIRRGGYWVFSTDVNHLRRMLDVKDPITVFRPRRPIRDRIPLPDRDDRLPPEGDSLIDKILKNHPLLRELLADDDTGQRLAGRVILRNRAIIDTLLPILRAEAQKAPEPIRQRLQLVLDTVGSLPADLPNTRIDLRAGPDGLRLHGVNLLEWLLLPFAVSYIKG